MERKRDRMLSNGLLRDTLLKTKLRPSEQPVYLRSDGYMALGCDLKDLATLERILRAEFDVPATSVLFVAEVSVTYMPLKDSDALIRWASTLEDGMLALRLDWQGYTDRYSSFLYTGYAACLRTAFHTLTSPLCRAISSTGPGTSLCQDHAVAL